MYEIHNRVWITTRWMEKYIDDELGDGDVVDVEVFLSQAFF
jgi:hypothetical protein